jgi:hypothetical protein
MPMHRPNVKMGIQLTDHFLFVFLAQLDFPFLLIFIAPRAVGLGAGRRESKRDGAGVEPAFDFIGEILVGASA